MALPSKIQRIHTNQRGETKNKNKTSPLELFDFTECIAKYKKLDGLKGQKCILPKVLKARR
jgi:hypothetical protein